MSATLAATLEAVTALVDTVPAVVRAYNGPQEQINEAPAAEVRFSGPTVTRDLERHRVWTGIIRLYVPRMGDLPAEYATLVGLVDAVILTMGTDPFLGARVDRFDVSGGTVPGETEVGGQTFLTADVAWSATTTEGGSLVQDW